MTELYKSFSYFCILIVKLLAQLTQESSIAARATITKYLLRAPAVSVQNLKYRCKPKKKHYMFNI